MRRRTARRLQSGIDVKALASLLLVGVVSTASPLASADESAYCRKVRARASSDAALMFAPSVQAHGIKFPNNGTIDSGVTTGAGYQFRAVLTFSPLDFYRGFRVLRLGDADCEQHLAVEEAQNILEQGADFGRLPALRRQVAILDAKRSTWQALLAMNEERLAAHTISLADATEVRARVSDLELKRTRVAGEISKLEARGLESTRKGLATLAADVRAAAMRFEREASHVRALDAWDVRVTGGVIPQDKPVDFFGMIQVGYNFGGFWRNAYESRYLDARAEELRGSRHELEDRLSRFRDAMRSAATQARGELAVVEHSLTTLGTARAALEKSDAPGAPHALTVVELELVSIESDREFLTALLEELTRLQEESHGQ
jgi:hypothetical protein